MRDALACILYQIAQEIKPLLLIFGIAPSKNLTLTGMVGVQTLGYGLSNLNGVKSQKKKTKLRFKEKYHEQGWQFER